MTYFHVTDKQVNMPFNKDHVWILNLSLLEDTLHENCRKNFQVSFLISGVFWNQFLLVQETI